MAACLRGLLAIRSVSRRRTSKVVPSLKIQRLANSLVKQTVSEIDNQNSYWDIVNINEIICRSGRLGCMIRLSRAFFGKGHSVAYSGNSPDHYIALTLTPGAHPTKLHLHLLCWCSLNLTYLLRSTGTNALNN